MIIYLHGFNSAGFGQKFTTLSKMFPQQIVLSPTYPAQQPLQTIKQLSNSINQILVNRPNENIMLIGSSLGGFYGLWLAQYFQFKCVCINPALDPINALISYVGKNTNYYTNITYSFTEAMVNELKQFYLNAKEIHCPVLALIDKGDELINYRTSLNYLPTSTVIRLFEKGDHRFQHLIEASPYIRQFYNDC